MLVSSPPFTEDLGGFYVLSGGSAIVRALAEYEDGVE